MLRNLDPERANVYDDFARAITTISSTHRMIHDGFMYETSGKQLAWTTGTVKRFLISTPALTFPHVQSMILNFGRGDIDFEAFEGATTSADGSALTVQNTNRNSSNTPDTALYGEPTITGEGTPIFTLWIPPTGTGVGQTANGVSDMGQGTEWILKPSTKYLIKLTNNSGATIDWSYEFLFYEIDY